MAAEADPALHVSFHGEVDLRRIDAELKELHGRKPHHDLRSAYHRQGICRIERCFGEEAGNDADMSLPASNGAVHRDENVEIKTRTPPFEIFFENDVLRFSGSVQEDQFAELLAPRKRFVDNRSQRGEPDPSRNDHKIGADGGLNGPDRPVGPADAQYVAAMNRAHGERHSAHSPDGVDKCLGFRGVSADRDRYLADSVNVHHVELSRPERQGGSVLWFEFQREHIVRFTFGPQNPEWPRYEMRFYRGVKNDICFRHLFHRRRVVGVWLLPGVVPSSR